MRYAARVAVAVMCAMAVVLLAGCASGREYGSAMPVFDQPDKTVPVQITDPEIAKAFEARPQLSLPSEVAVFEQTHPTWGYRMPQNEMGDRIRELLEGSPAFTKAVVIAPSFINGPVSPRTVRLAAAYHKAPLALLCDDDFRVMVDYSPLCILNLAILPAFVLPSTTVEVQTRIGVHLMDTRNGYIYFSRVLTKTWKSFIPSGLGEGKVEKHRRELTEQSYEELLADLKQELARAVQPKTEQQ